MTQMLGSTEHRGWDIGKSLDRIVVVKVWGQYYRLGHPVSLNGPNIAGVTLKNGRGIIMKIRMPSKKYTNGKMPKEWDHVLKVWFEGTYYPIWISPSQVTPVDPSS